MGYCRRPRTTPERRDSQGDLDWDGLVRVRPRRNHNNLPNNYDDIRRKPWDRRSWKYYRRHQWKAKDNRPRRDSSRYAAHMRRRGTQKQWRGRRPRSTRRFRDLVQSLRLLVPSVSGE